MPLILSSSSPSSSYYKLATSVAASSSASISSSSTSAAATSSSSLPFPEWWPPPSSTSDDDAALNHPNQYIKFADHVAHLVIPEGNIVTLPINIGNEAAGENNSNADDRGVDNDATTSKQMFSTSITNVEEAVRYVIDCAIRRNAINLSSTTTPSRTITIPVDHEYRRCRIEKEWYEGEQVSTDTRVLDPAYRHDPTLLPQHKPTTFVDDTTISNGNINLIASELLALGSVWYLPLHRSTHASSSANTSPTSSASIGYDRFDPANGSKPTRLTVGESNRTIHPGDYFRVHFDPRRFADANLYDWGRKAVSVTAAVEMDSELYYDDGSVGRRPGVTVKRDDDAGYIIIDKPANIPVHARVDNLLENVASCVGRMLWIERQNELPMAFLNGGGDDASVADCSGLDQDDNMAVNGNSTYMEGGRPKRRVRQQRKPKIEPFIYVATPQRLDQNTSGLLVVATKKSFASYFAKLLRMKTSRTLRHGGEASSQFSEGGVHKSYRCLVCIFAPRHETGHDDRDVETIVANEVDRLRRYTDTIMRHFLEPSIRAPKRFVGTVPEDAANADSYAECLLRITNVSEAFVVAANNNPSYTLSKSLWGEHGMPDGCVAVAECEIELLTGRTHQIRGQLAAEGFPLVGDVQYGGAVPTTSSIWKERCKGRVESFLDSECLALQCCSLEFLDPQHDVDSDALDQWKRSERWLSFRLDSAFWSPFLHKFTRDISTMASALNN
ncbi:hypothetical protein ACHAXH_001702 [Discostella pseudostelligera]